MLLFGMCLFSGQSAYDLDLSFLVWGRGGGKHAGRIINAFAGRNWECMAAP